MTPHAQKLRLATLDGWRLCSRDRTGRLWERKGVVVDRDDLPRYTESLDALRPILLKLTFAQAVEYYNYLCAAIYGYKYEGEIAPVRLLVASAAQVSEAILRAVGKYT